MPELLEQTTKAKVWHFLESPIAWGGIGLLGGAIIVLVPVVGLKWIFLVAWGLLVVALLRENFWKGKGAPRRIIANILLSVLFGAPFVAGWHYLPKPKEPITPEEQATLTAKRIIELMPPPQGQTSQSEPVRVQEKKEKSLKAGGAFAVAVETRIFAPPGGGLGTSFWAGSLAPGGCALKSVQAALFIRITNLQKERTLITAYSLEAMGIPLTRLKMNLYRPFVILGKGVLRPSNQPGAAAVQIPVPQGGIGSLVTFKLDDAYPAEARPIHSDFLDPQIAGHYLEHKQMVRGWSYFQYPSQGAVFPARLTLKISDETGQSFSYSIPDKGSDQNTDAMSRTMSFGPTVDLSACSTER